MKRFFLALFFLTAAMHPHHAYCQSLDSIYGIHLYSPDNEDGSVDDGFRGQIREIRNKGITYKAIYQYVIDSNGHIIDSVVIAQYSFAVLPNRTLKEISVLYDSEALTLPDSLRIDTFVYDPYDRYIFSKTHKRTAITVYRDSLGYVKRRWIFPDSEMVDSFTFNREGREIFSKESGWTVIHTFDSIGQWNGGKVWDASGRLVGSSTTQTKKSPSGTVETTLWTSFLDSTGNPKQTKQRRIATNDYQKHQCTISDYKWINKKWKLQQKSSYDSTLRVMESIDSNLGFTVKTWLDDHDSSVRGELNNKLVYTELRTYDENGMPLSTVESRSENKGRKVRTDYYYEYGEKK